MKKIFKKIKFEDIICVNKRQVNKDDVNKFSIHYKTKQKLEEIKLKASGRKATELWIVMLRRKITEKNDLFHLEDGEENIKENLKGYKQYPKECFVKLGRLEFMLNTILLHEFFIKFKNNRTLKNIDFLNDSQYSINRENVIYIF